MLTVKSAMRACSLVAVLVVCGVPVAGAPAPSTRDAAASPDAAALAPELSGLGTLHVPVSTAVPQAQRFFDQGMRLLYAFNHAEAIRAFREAARLDPSLAMAYWGQALALGPNLNAPMTSRERPRRVRRDPARRWRRAPRVTTARERALIDALAARYAPEGGGDRPALDRAYAVAMQKVAGTFPGRPRRPDAVRRRADEHDAVGLLAEGRSAEAGDGACARRARARDRAACRSCRRAALSHSPARGVARSRSRRAQRGSARPADAGRWTHGPHAGAHLHSRRPLRGRGRGQRARDSRRRGLPGAVSGAGAVPGQLLPAQPALPVGGGDVRGTPCSRRRCGAPRRGEGAASSRRRAGVDGRFSGDADAGLRAIRDVAGRADRAEAAGEPSRMPSGSGTTRAAWRLSRAVSSIAQAPSSPC